MNKTKLILKYFQKKDKLTVEERGYQKTLSALFKWLITNDNVSNDKTSKYFPNIFCSGRIVSKDSGVIAGLEEIEYLLKTHTNLSFKPKLSDGQKFKEKDIIAEIYGKSHEILAYERTILNILQRMSGIATETSSIISLISPISQIHIAATRKTPWMFLDKKAVAVGGGLTHRLNLSDGILIKDNHLKVISKAIKPPRQRTIQDRFFGSSILDRRGSGQLIEIEVESENQAHQVLTTFKRLKAHNHLAILLDNFTPSQAKSLLRNLSNPSTSLRTGLYDLSEVIFEASGGITKENIKEWSKTGVDIVSLGSLTHSNCATNLSLEF